MLRSGESVISSYGQGQRCAQVTGEQRRRPPDSDRAHSGGFLKTVHRIQVLKRGGVTRARDRGKEVTKMILFEIALCSFGWKS